MAKKSKRAWDVSNERALQPFLDAVYRELGFDFRRVDAKELQLKGIDIIIRHGIGEYPIDEKGQTQWVNKGLKTFAFELEFKSAADELRPGWLFDGEKVTTHYFLVYDIRSSSSNVSDLVSFRLVSVNREYLIAFLENKGWGNRFMTEDVPMLMGDRKYHILSKSDPAVKVVRTRHLVEEPLNVVIRLNDLIEAGVAKELVPGKKGMEFWKRIFLRVSNTGKSGVAG
jgi:hypothetical protein